MVPFIQLCMLQQRDNFSSAWHANARQVFICKIKAAFMFSAIHETSIRVRFVAVVWTKQDIGAEGVDDMWSRLSCGPGRFCNYKHPGCSHSKIQGDAKFRWTRWRAFSGPEFTWVSKHDWQLPGLQQLTGGFAYCLCFQSSLSSLNLRLDHVFDLSPQHIWAEIQIERCRVSQCVSAGLPEAVFLQPCDWFASFPVHPCIRSPACSWPLPPMNHSKCKKHAAPLI